MVMEIKVLGPGCLKCQQTEKVVKEAVAQAGAQAQVVKVTGMMEIAAFGVMMTPALVVDGQVKLVGKVPSRQEVLDLLAKAGA
jgi:small redox-active disulfide protein 2